MEAPGRRSPSDVMPDFARIYCTGCLKVAHQLWCTLSRWLATVAAVASGSLEPCTATVVWMVMAGDGAAAALWLGSNSGEYRNACRRSQALVWPLVGGLVGIPVRRQLNALSCLVSTPDR